MKVFYFFLVLGTLLGSCSEEEEEPRTAQENKPIHKNERRQRFKTIKSEDDKLAENDGDWVDINFPGLTVSVQDIDMGSYDDMNNDSTIGKTAYFDLYPGDWMFDKNFKIKNEKWDLVRLYVRTEVHIGIDSKQIMEVPFCVLNSWKNHVNKWQRVELKKGKYNFGSGDVIDNAVINYTIDELKEAIEVDCDERWVEEFKNTKSLEDISNYLFTSSYTYKFVVRNSKTGEKLERFIVFYTPTHC